MCLLYIIMVSFGDIQNKRSLYTVGPDGYTRNGTYTVQDNGGGNYSIINKATNSPVVEDIKSFNFDTKGINGTYFVGGRRRRAGKKSRKARKSRSRKSRRVRR